MRRIALGVVVVLAGVGVAVGMAASGPAVGLPASPLTLTASGADHPPVVPPVVLGSGPIWGYWGKITGGDTGSYRATCVLLGAPTSSANARLPTYAGRVRAADGTAENRLSCHIVLSFGGEDTQAGTLIAEGLVLKPNANQGLFDLQYVRRLAITGGSGTYYSRKQGSASLDGHGKIVITYQ
ncbi:MAG: hypothetical protein V7607_3009 [Solirubrobacteraceae bacterium]